jgi:hypothetical protein
LNIPPNITAFVANPGFPSLRRYADKILLNTQQGIAKNIGVRYFFAKISNSLSAPEKQKSGSLNNPIIIIARTESTTP